MRILQTVAGIILLGGAAWATVRTYKGRGTSSILILAFALFLVALGLYFLVDAISAWLQDFRVGPEYIGFSLISRVSGSYLCRSARIPNCASPAPK